MNISDISSTGMFLSFASVELFKNMCSVLVELAQLGCVAVKEVCAKFNTFLFDNETNRIQTCLKCYSALCRIQCGEEWRLIWLMARHGIGLASSITIQFYAIKVLADMPRETTFLVCQLHR